ncbi:MAG: hypothetical protein JST30_14545 [Armatimonadetes bacterium]|nr:hypothetical protein [Armatimonadota bacterium]
MALTTFRNTILVLCLSVASATPRQASPLARWIKGDKRGDLKTNAPVDEKVRNCIVRVGKPYLFFRDKPVGPISTGTVIRAVDLGENKGVDLWVLTADHVARPVKDRKFLGVYIGFGDDVAEYPKFKAKDVIYGDKIKNPVGGKPIDVAVLIVHVDKNTDVPALAPPKIAEVDKDKPLVLAGYGRAASEFNNDDTEQWYQIDRSIKFGTLRIGLDTLDERKANVQVDSDIDHPITYLFDALVGSLQFQRGFVPPDNKVRTEVSGDAYVLSGDSGGPTLQQKGEDWVLVGVHSQSNKEDGKNRVYSGYSWDDVDLFKYKTEIEAKAGLGGWPGPTFLSLFVLSEFR